MIQCPFIIRLSVLTGRLCETDQTKMILPQFEKNLIILLIRQISGTEETGLKTRMDYTTSQQNLPSHNQNLKLESDTTIPGSEPEKINNNNNNNNKNTNKVSNNSIDDDDTDDNNGNNTDKCDVSSDDGYQNNKDRKEIAELHMQVVKLCAEKADLAIQLSFTNGVPAAVLELEELRSEHAKCLEKRSQALDETNRLIEFIFNENECHQQQVDDLQNRLDALMDNPDRDNLLIDLQQTISSLKSEKTASHILISKLNHDMTSIQTTNTDNDQVIKNLKEKISLLEGVNRDNNQTIDDLIDELDLLKKIPNNDQLVTELKIKVVSLEAEQSSNQQQIKELKQHITVEDKDTTDSQMLSELKEKVVYLTKQKFELEQKLIQYEKDKDSIDIESLIKYDEEICKMKEELLQAKSDNASYMKTIEMLRDEVNGLKQNRESLDLAADALISAEELIASGQRYSDAKDSHLIRLQMQKESAEQQIQKLQAVVQSHEMKKELQTSFSLKKLENDTEKLSNTLKDLSKVNKDQSEVIIGLQKEIKMKEEQIIALNCSKDNWEQTTISLKRDVYQLQEHIFNLEKTKTNKNNFKYQLALLEKEKLSKEKFVKETIEKYKLLKVDNLKINAQLSAISNEKQSLESSIANLKRQLKQSLADKSKIRENLRSSESKLNCNSEEVSQLKYSLKSVKSQLSVIKTQRDKAIDRISSPGIISELNKKHSLSCKELSTPPEKPNEQKLMKESISSHVINELKDLKASYEEIQRTCKELEDNLKNEKSGKQTLQQELLNRDELLEKFRCNSDALFTDKAEELSKMEKELQDSHREFNDKLTIIESELQQAKLSAEELELYNVKYVKELEKERSDRDLQANKARQLIRESRQTIKDLNQRAILTEESHSQSKLVIGQLSQRLLKSLSDYKYLQEVSMQRCEELIREAEGKK